MLELALNNYVNNKTKDYVVFNSKFENKKLSSKELLNHILNGHAFCIAKLNKSSSKYCLRKSENFIHGQLIAIDIDNKIGNKKMTSTEGYRTFEEVCNDKTISSLASFIYSTPTHKPNHHRFRIVFVMDNPVIDKAEFKLYITELTRIFKGDPATTSVIQGFFGSKDAEYKYFGHNLNQTTISSLMEKHKTRPKSIMNIDAIHHYNLNDFIFKDYKELLSSIFKDGKVDNDTWWRIPTILKSYCRLPTHTILNLINSTIGEIGDTLDKIDYSDTYIGTMHLGHLVQLAQNNGYNLPNRIKPSQNSIKFWSTHRNIHPNSKNNLTIDIKYTLFEDFLVQNGFRSYRKDKSRLVVKINKLNHIKIITEQEIREYVYSYLRKNNALFSLPNEKHLVNERLRRQSDKIFGTTIRNLPIINRRFEKSLISDDRDTIFLQMKNGLLEINKDKIKLNKYEDIKEIIWDETILSNEFMGVDIETSVFESFVRCVCTTRVSQKQKIFNQDKYKTLVSAMGYLVSRYKNKSETFAIVLTDEKLSDAVEGGTGKSIFLEAIGKVRCMKEIDGQTLDLNSNFAFSDIEPFHEVINIDDCDNNFKFKKLFHSITGDLNIEKKNQNKLNIPFSNSPKFCLSTNHVFKGNGYSHDRRKIEIEFSNYFNSKHTPLDEFEHQLFYDWDSMEWNRFFNFIIYCCQYYLENGVKKYDQVNLIKKRLYETIGKELADFFENYIELEQVFIKNELFDEYNRLNRSQISLRTFKIALTYWAESYNNYFLIDKLQRKYKLYATIITSKEDLNINELIDHNTKSKFESYSRTK